jgi:antitoxin component HigA of HigAB toxin-antitoxin module
MQLKLIKNEKAYDETLNRIDELMQLNPKLGTKESDELEILALLIEKYEEQNWAISTQEAKKRVADGVDRYKSGKGSYLSSKEYELHSHNTSIFAIVYPPHLD